MTTIKLVMVVVVVGPALLVQAINFRTTWFVRVDLKHSFE